MSFHSIQTKQKNNNYALKSERKAALIVSADGSLSDFSKEEQYKISRKKDVLNNLQGTWWFTPGKGTITSWKNEFQVNILAEWIKDKC